MDWRSVKWGLSIAALFWIHLEARADVTVARTWNEAILAAIRNDAPNPPVQARNLCHLSVAMYDAWAAYDLLASGYIYQQKHAASDVAAARREAISYAAYRILRERYSISRSPALILPGLDAQMFALGYDTNNTTTDPSTPAGVGNAIAAAVSARFINDGARQAFRYTDAPAGAGGYVPVNEPLDPRFPGANVVDINRWQRLNVANAVDQSGVPIPALQTFVGAHWLYVNSFALVRDLPNIPWIDPGPQPALNGIGDAEFRQDIVGIIRKSSELTPDDGVLIDISPGRIGNNPLGTNEGEGYAVNPATGQPYTPNFVKRGDFARVLAEFWADGPNSETPPGHWNAIANSVSDAPGFLKRIGGTGPVVDDLEWDVKVYFALNAALHDAACAAWSLKRYYDGPRPISIIRYMGSLGQSSDPAGPSYHPSGLPLVPDLIEVVTAETAQPSAKHEGLPVGAVVLRCWPGQPASPTSQHSGVKWIEATKWLPYQRETFVTPAFPGYISGHSTFSRAAAEVLTSITGSRYFPGGIGTFTAPADTFLSFERGPTTPIQLQWATYYDAADQAGLSRLWGGIHVSTDDLTGRRAGAICGKEVWSLARHYFGASPVLVKGEQVSGAASGTTYGSFSVPQPGAAVMPVVFKKKTTAALVAPSGAILLKAGDAVPGISGSQIKRFNAASGDAAVLALAPGKGGVTPQTGSVLMTGVLRGEPVVAVRAGVTVTSIPGVTVKTIIALDGNGEDVFFLATLQGVGVNATNNLALCSVRADQSVHVLVRKNDFIQGRRITGVSTLTGSKGSLAEGRWRLDDNHIGVRFSFADKSQAIYLIPGDASTPNAWTQYEHTGMSDALSLAGAEIASFGLPGFAPQHWAVLANLTPGVAGVTRERSKAIIAKRQNGPLNLLAFSGGPVADYTGATIPYVKFKQLGDPLVGVKGRTAFLGSITGSQVSGSNSQGIWYSPDGSQVKLLARTGDTAPGGGHWAGFSSVVLPNHIRSGPIFLATLTRSEVDGIPKGGAGIWAADDDGNTSLLLRTGQNFPFSGVEKTIKGIKALLPSGGAIGSASGHGDSGRLSVAVTFTDGSEVLLQF